jgi:hypothetical protein
MKIPHPPLYQRGVKGGFSCFVVPAPSMGVIHNDARVEHIEDGGDHVVVVAIIHTRRQPGYWKNRMFDVLPDRK